MRTTILSLFLILIAGCSQPEKAPNRAGQITGKSLSETIQENQQHLRSISGVIRVEAGDCGIDSCIRVVVGKKTEMLANQIPPMLETWRVEVIEEVR